MINSKIAFIGVLKSRLKSLILAKLHAKPELVSRFSTRVLREGVPRYVNWAYEVERIKTLEYIESVRVGDYDYRFSRTAPAPTLYGSCYAFMLEAMFGGRGRESNSRQHAWLDYFDAHQDEQDGLFRDAALAGAAYEGKTGWGDGWGARHLTAHIVICYARLGRAPRFPLRILEPYYDPTYLSNWLAGFRFSSNVWSQSNSIMNVYTLLQFARDYMGQGRAVPAVESIRNWLLTTQRGDTGMWHEYAIYGYPEIGDAIRGAYHFYPIFVYDGQPIQYAEAVVDSVLRSQNSWGGFSPDECASGACEDIDAIEPLIRACVQTGYRRTEVETSLRRAMVWILACRNSDGGYESIPENECPYGGHPLTTSAVGEGNLFATWFRTLCLAYVVEFLGIQNDFELGVFPGYEIALNHGRASQ